MLNPGIRHGADASGRIPVVDKKLVARSGGSGLYHTLDVCGFDIFRINQCPAHSVFLGNDLPDLSVSERCFSFPAH